MKPWVVGEVHVQLAKSLCDRDHATTLRLLTERIENTDGPEKAYWLNYRASFWQMFGPAQAAAFEADLAEARRVDPLNPTVVVVRVLERFVFTQDSSLISTIPRSMRSIVRRELYPSWRFWGLIGSVHWMRRRFPQCYRANTRMLNLYLNIPPEEARSNSGWIFTIAPTRARAALRCGQPKVAEADLALVPTQEIGPRHPFPLALARAELAFVEGNYDQARREIQWGRNVMAEGDMKSNAFIEMECELLAARLARAEGNMMAFEHFCQKALAVATGNNLPLTAAGVREVMNGSLW